MSLETGGTFRKEQIFFWYDMERVMYI
jgi:hypothetical protein